MVIKVINEEKIDKALKQYFKGNDRYTATEWSLVRSMIIVMTAKDLENEN